LGGLFAQEFPLSRISGLSPPILPPGTAVSVYSHRALYERLHGDGYTIGSVTGDHWFVFVADHTKRRKALEVDTDRVLNIMMFDIDEQFAQNFYDELYPTSESEPAAVPIAVDDDSNNNSCSKEVTTTRVSLEQTTQHIQALCPGATIDARAFEPVRLFHECHFVSLRHDHEPKGQKLPIALCQCAPDLLTAALCVDAASSWPTRAGLKKEGRQSVWWRWHSVVPILLPPRRGVHSSRRLLLLQDGELGHAKDGPDDGTE
jgi:Adenosylmethionine decarboxylase